ncbi:MAG: hypothetical protein Q8880_12880 [Bacteroidota bacterium]|nr:hypothetical protein [Bacteroidota bacterium]
MLKQYTEEFLIRELFRFIKIYGRLPIKRDMCVKKGFPSYRVYITYFGSWNKALLRAGLKIHDGLCYTKNFLIKELQRAAKNLGRVPTKRDMILKNGYPDYKIYQSYFGSWNNALIAANLNINQMNHKYDGSEYCTICGTNHTKQWHGYDKKQLCDLCYKKKWNIDHPELVHINKFKQHHKRRCYGCNPINKKFLSSNGHHLWLNEDKSLVIFIPEFLHKLHYHNHAKPETLQQINCIAIDFWINEEFYRDLYELI